ncbi:3-alpha,7-alpha,12-alpha-trihydroxy-5-beta-cholest-24-enoyl-CoA hydratase [Rhodobacterales bacterium HKCCE2091]|nr:3-alpha,7-alpha,12-alpha-trihydroxy-5-beta-cholest-24-enoyl-CoA hydratase [Rhodobacterales bacterium HKCCE2091]
MLDYAKVRNFGPLASERDWTERDTILYALGLGAEDLDFVYEDRLRVLPTMICVMGYPGFIWRDQDMGIDWTRIVHAEQEVIRHAPLPVEGRFAGSTRIEAVADKGAEKGAIVYSSREIRDGRGQLIATSRAATMARADGGFDPTGGDAAPWGQVSLPKREPDESVTLPTASNQALIYRLSGDVNPLHIDPEVARTAGFDRPILHGMCTFGVAGRALLGALCGNDPDRFRSMRCRFTAPVYPGDTIRTEIWRSGSGQAHFRAIAEERGVTVLSNGHMTFEDAA